MRIVFQSLFLSLILFAAVPLAAQDEDQEGPWPDTERPEITDETSLKLIELHLKARGGRDALKKVRTITCEGELVEGQKDYALDVIFGSPKNIRYVTDRFFRGYNYITTRGYDGKNAWTQETSPKRKNPRSISGYERQMLELEAVLPFLFLEAYAHGTVFKYMGEDTFAKKKVYVVHTWLRNGLELEVLLDASSFQIINYRQPYKFIDNVVVVDRMPTGLTRIMDTWWENGYTYTMRGKSMQKVSYASMKGSPDHLPQAYEEPVSHERWLKITEEE